RPWRPRAGASGSCKIRTIGAGRRRPGAPKPEHGNRGRTSHAAAENGKGAVIGGAHVPPGDFRRAGGGDTFGIGSQASCRRGYRTGGGLPIMSTRQGSRTAQDAFLSGDTTRTIRREVPN